MPTRTRVGMLLPPGHLMPTSTWACHPILLMNQCPDESMTQSIADSPHLPPPPFFTYYPKKMRIKMLARTGLIAGLLIYIAVSLGCMIFAPPEQRAIRPQY